MLVKYLGHSCFSVVSEGYTIVTDPYEDGTGGYAPLAVTANKVLASHGHYDHAAFDKVTVVDEDKPSPFHITEFEIPHDDVGGTKRGMNTVRIFDDGKCKVAHLGDIGCEPTDEQYEMLKGLDALLIPVGGFYTIDAAMAKHICDAVKPKTIIPMHYRDDTYGFDVIAHLNDFVSQYDNVIYAQSNTIEIPSDQPIVVLKYQG